MCLMRVILYWISFIYIPGQTFLWCDVLNKPIILDLEFVFLEPIKMNLKSSFPVWGPYISAPMFWAIQS